MTGSVQDQDSSGSCNQNSGNIFVLLWNYGDNSSFGIERVYENKSRAEADLQLLESTHSMKTFQLVELPITK